MNMQSCEQPTSAECEKDGGATIDDQVGEGVREGVVRVGLHREQSEIAHLAWVVGNCHALEKCAIQRLHDKELSHLRGLRFERRRQSYLLGRLSARLAIAGQVGEKRLARLAVLSGVFTQPVICDGPSELAISISHAGNAGCSIAHPVGHPIGIDIEQPDPNRIDAMLTQVSEDELNNAGLSEACKSELLTVCWTAKEALSKILRCGMMCPFDLLSTKSVTRHAGGYAGEFVNFSQYRFVSWLLGTGHVLTIALPKRTRISMPAARLAAGFP